MSGRGFTLMEVLAVVVLLTLAMAATATGIAGASDASKLRAATAAALDLDRRARLHAQTGVRVVLTAGPGRLSLSRQPTGELLADVALPPGITVRSMNSKGDRPYASIVFNLAGGTPDYRLVISLHDQARTVLIAGLTGWSEELQGAAR